MIKLHACKSFAFQISFKSGTIQHYKNGKNLKQKYVLHVMAPSYFTLLKPFMADPFDILFKQ